MPIFDDYLCTLVIIYPTNYQMQTRYALQLCAVFIFVPTKQIINYLL